MRSVTLTIFVKLKRGTQVRMNANEIKITWASCKLDKHVRWYKRLFRKRIASVVFAYNTYNMKQGDTENKNSVRVHRREQEAVD